MWSGGAGALWWQQNTLLLHPTPYGAGLLSLAQKTVRPPPEASEPPVGLGITGYGHPQPVTGVRAGPKGGAEAQRSAWEAAWSSSLWGRNEELGWDFLPGPSGAWREDRRQ